MQEINIIEHSIHLPQGAAPLPSYERYYRYETRYGKKGISADYLLKRMIPYLHDRIALPGDELPSAVHRVAEDEGPFVSDGGCGHIGVFFDQTTNAVRAICASPYTDFRKVPLGPQPRHPVL